LGETQYAVKRGSLNRDTGILLSCAPQDRVNSVVLPSLPPTFRGAFWPAFSFD